MTKERARVGDLLSLQRRAVVVEPEAEYLEIGIRSFGRGIFHKDPVSGTDLGNKRVFRIEPDDLVISNVFAWEGAIAVAGPDERGRIGSHRFMTFVPVDRRIDTSWAAWFFRSEAGLELIRRASPGSAGRNRTLAVDRFEALEISIPPIDQQRRIAGRLDRLEAAASKLRRLAGRTSALSRALAVSTASRPDLDNSTRERAGWRRVTLAEVILPSTVKVRVEPSQQYRIAGIYSFGRGLIDRGVISGADTAYNSLTVLHEGDIVLSKLNGWEGAVAVVGQMFDGHCVSSEYPTFTVDREQLLPAFFSGIARSPSFWDALDSNARGSMVRRRRISAAEFLKAQIWLPPIETQRDVAGQLQTIDRAAQAREVCLARTDALVPAALNAAFGSVN